MTWRQRTWPSIAAFVLCLASFAAAGTCIVELATSDAVSRAAIVACVVACMASPVGVWVCYVAGYELSQRHRHHKDLIQQEFGDSAKAWRRMPSPSFDKPFHTWATPEQWQIMNDVINWAASRQVIVPAMFQVQARPPLHETLR